MANVNKHGLTIKGLRKASGETGACPGTSYVSIYYSRADGTVLVKYHYTNNEYTVYHDANIILVCNTRVHMTMQAIADNVAFAVKREAEMAAELAAYYKGYNM